MSVRQILHDILLQEDSGQTVDGLTQWIVSQHRWLFAFEKRLTNYYRQRYEDFVNGEIRSLERYLSFSLTGGATVDQTHDHVPRTKSSGDWKNWFLEEDIEYFRPTFQLYMDYYGYADDWEMHSIRVIRPEHCSQFVERAAQKLWAMG